MQQKSRCESLAIQLSIAIVKRCVCSLIFQLIGTYSPYIVTKTNNNTIVWGKSQWHHINNIDFRDSSLFRKFDNLHGYPLKVSMFERYPTAIRSRQTPKIFLDSYFMNTIDDSKGFGGLDGIVLGNLARVFNFTTIIIPPNRGDYGYKLRNGSFVGSLQ